MGAMRQGRYPERAPRLFYFRMRRAFIMVRADPRQFRLRKLWRRVCPSCFSAWTVAAPIAASGWPMRTSIPSPMRRRPFQPADRQRRSCLQLDHRGHGEVFAKAGIDIAETKNTLPASAWPAAGCPRRARPLRRVPGPSPACRSTTTSTSPARRRAWRRRWRGDHRGHRVGRPRQDRRPAPPGGGWGFHIGDQMSGAILGRELVRRAVEATDGFVEGSPLTEAVGRNARRQPRCGHGLVVRRPRPADYGASCPCSWSYFEKGDPVAKELMALSWLHRQLRELVQGTAASTRWRPSAASARGFIRS
jgi:hypothetical protein